MAMIVLAVILSLASLIGASTIPCICTMEYLPVCGTDNKTYGNKCDLGCAGVQLSYEGECKKAGTFGSHVCACPRIYMPVCGQDGVTYANQCEMNCAGVAFFQDGACPSTPSTPSTSTGGIHKRAVPCICTFIYLPVCGSDGITYGNQCNLNCAAAAVPTGATKISKVSDGQCPVSTTTTKAPASG